MLQSGPGEGPSITMNGLKRTAHAMMQQQRSQNDRAAEAHAAQPKEKGEEEEEGFTRSISLYWNWVRGQKAAARLGQVGNIFCCIQSNKQAVWRVWRPPGRRLNTWAPGWPEAAALGRLACSLQLSAAALLLSLLCCCCYHNPPGTPPPPPPPPCSQGLNRNSSALILQCEHWLEAADPKHRYGTNLRPYFDCWLNQQAAAREPASARRPYIPYSAIPEIAAQATAEAAGGNSVSGGAAAQQQQQPEQRQQLLAERLSNNDAAAEAADRKSVV